MGLPFCPTLSISIWEMLEQVVMVRRGKWQWKGEWKNQTAMADQVGLFPQDFLVQSTIETQHLRNNHFKKMGH